MRALLVFGIAVALGLGLAERGRSCTTPVPLYPTEPRAVVADADAAFTGTLIAVRPRDPEPGFIPSPLVFTFAVEDRIRGDLGDRVEARPWSCAGVDSTIGRRGSYVLFQRAGDWFVEEIALETLRKGLVPFPPPNGSGRSAFVVGGHFGLVRTAVLDARGRTLSYGAGRGAVTALSVCPGRRVVAELVQVGDSLHFALRALPSLRLLHETELVATGFGDTVACLSRTGSDVLATMNVYDPERATTQLLRITPVGTSVIEQAATLAFAVAGGKALISLSDGRIVRRDLASGSRSLLLRMPLPLRGMSVSPDQRYLVGFTGEKLLLVDLTRGVTHAKPWLDRAGQTRWTGPRSVAVWSRAGGALTVFDPELNVVGPDVSWAARATTVSGTVLFGVDWAGRLLTQRDGRIVRLGTLFSPAVSVLEPL
jgi:hypothetical protein